MIDEMKKHIGENVKIVMNYYYYGKPVIYKGQLLEVKQDFVKIRDINNSIVLISVDEIKEVVFYENNK